MSVKGRTCHPRRSPTDLRLRIANEDDRCTPPDPQSARATRRPRSTTLLHPQDQVLHGRDRAVGSPNTPSCNADGFQFPTSPTLPTSADGSSNRRSALQEERGRPFLSAPHRTRAAARFNLGGARVFRGAYGTTPFRRTRMLPAPRGGRFRLSEFDHLHSQPQRRARARGVARKQDTARLAFRIEVPERGSCSDQAERMVPTTGVRSSTRPVTPITSSIHRNDHGRGEPWATTRSRKDGRCCSSTHDLNRSGSNAGSICPAALEFAAEGAKQRCSG